MLTCLLAICSHFFSIPPNKRQSDDIWEYGSVLNVDAHTYPFVAPLARANKVWVFNLLSEFYFFPWSPSTLRNSAVSLEKSATTFSLFHLMFDNNIEDLSISKINSKLKNLTIYQQKNLCLESWKFTPPCLSLYSDGLLPLLTPIPSLYSDRQQYFVSTME